MWGGQGGLGGGGGGGRGAKAKVHSTFWVVGGVGVVGGGLGKVGWVVSVKLAFTRSSRRFGVIAIYLQKCMPRVVVLY